MNTSIASRLYLDRCEETCRGSQCQKDYKGSNKIGVLSWCRTLIFYKIAFDTVQREIQSAHNATLTNGD